MRDRAAEFVLVLREHPHGDAVQGPEQQPRPLRFQIAAQPKIKHVLDAVAEALATIRAKHMRQQMSPGRFTGMAIEIGPPEFTQFPQRRPDQRFLHFLPFSYVMFAQFTQSIYPPSRSVCPSMLGSSLGISHAPPGAPWTGTNGGWSCRNARSGSCWEDC